MAITSDRQGLYSAPLYPGAVKWSEDNQLAVASGQAVIILNPCDLSGPRMFTTRDPPPSGTHHASLTVCLAGELPPRWSGLYYTAVLPHAGPLDVGIGPVDDLVHQVAGLRNPGANGVSQIFKHEPRLCSVDWSPAGCSARNSPLLTTTDTNGQARRCPCGSVPMTIDPRL